MRILKLRIQNLTTIANAELDFETGTLAEHPIFLLTGPTGSGKTSILDAITIALFGRAARLPNKQGGIADPTGELDNATPQDTRRLARRGAKESSIELDFLGNDGSPYTAKWNVCKLKKGARANKSWGDPKRALVFPDGTMIEKGIDDNIKRIINMDFGQFCQTTLLAQGDFTRFLKSDSNEKSAILEKILKVDIYTQISKKIYDGANDCKKRKELLESQIALIKVLTPEEAQDSERQLASLKTLCDSLHKQEEDLQHKILWLDASQKADDKLKKSLQAMQEAEAAAKAPSSLKEQQTVDLWDKTDSLRQHLHDKEAKQQKRHTETAKAPTYEAQFIQNISILAAREKTLSTLSQELTELNRQIDTLKQGQAATLPTNRQEATKAKNSADARKLLIGKSIQLLEQYAYAANNLSRLQNAYAEQQAEEVNLKVKLTKAQALSKKADADCNLAQNAYDDCVAQCSIAKELLSRLHEGDPCPVCGGTVNHIKHDDAFETLKKPYADKLAEAQAAKQKALDAKSTLEADYRANAKHLKESQKDIADAKPKRDTALTMLKTNILACGLAIDDFSDTQKIGDTLGKLDQEATINCDLLAKLQDLYDKQETAAKQVADAERQLLSARTDEANVRQLLPGWADKTPGDVKDNPHCDVATIWASFKTAMEAWRKNIKEIDAEIASAEAAISQAEKESEVDRATAKTLSDSFSQDSIAKLRTNIQSRDIRLAQTRTALTSAQQEVEDLKKGAPTLSDADTLTSLRAAKEAVNNQFGESNKQMGAISNSLKTDAENRKQRAQKTTELDKAKAEHEKWETLSNFLGSGDGKKFRNIALSFILGELLHYANNHLRELTGNRFTLMGDNNSLDILIRDAYHGDAPQTPGNLSGGESFMVSLALALGLSSMAKLGDSGADILFIDEGFGTLDDECLEKVMTMLERLKERGGKRVGIISHVDILRERIATQIRVEPENASQSRVTVVG